VLNEILPVERPLIAPYLTKVDKLIRTGIDDINWKSEGIDIFIAGALDQVRNMHDNQTTMKNNLASIEQISKEWNVSLIDRG
jgi:dynein heavy chain